LAAERSQLIFINDNNNNDDNSNTYDTGLVVLSTWQCCCESLVYL